VTLSLGNGPYQETLATALMGRNMLSRVLRISPQPEVLDPDGAGSLMLVKRFPSYRFAQRLFWGLWRRIPGTGHSSLPVVATSWLADRLLSEWVLPSRIFHGWSGLCLASLTTAKGQGAVSVVENPTLHPRRWQAAVMEECERFNLHPRDCVSILPEALIRRCEREYKICDRIVVLSSRAGQSFEELGYAQKVCVVWPGVDHDVFVPPVERVSPNRFRVCYVGRMELAKGLPYLLQAWKSLALPEAELVLVGEVRHEADLVLKQHQSPSVRIMGLLSRSSVAEIYRSSNVFVFPSVNEGFGLALLEAMASGLAVIATDRSGATDCVSEGKDGFVVPARSADALAEAILWCYRHRDETMAMGGAARKKVEARFTLAHYEQRQIDLYHSLVGTKAATATQ